MQRIFEFSPAHIQPKRITIPDAVRFMPTGQQVMPPMGYIGFCMEARIECTGGTDEPLPFALTPLRKRELDTVNTAVNALPERSDMALYGRDEKWTYARGLGGDCEDLALEKRRRLMALGWPQDALLMATAKDNRNNGHAVLVATTAEGDYVLDNRVADLRLWSATNYHWVSRQSRERPFVWVSLDEPRFALHPIASFPPLGRPAPFLDQTIMASLGTVSPVKPVTPSSASSEAIQAPLLRASQK